MIWQEPPAYVERMDAAQELIWLTRAAYWCEIAGYHQSRANLEGRYDLFMTAAVETGMSGEEAEQVLQDASDDVGSDWRRYTDKLSAQITTSDPLLIDFSSFLSTSCSKAAQDYPDVITEDQHTLRTSSEVFDRLVVRFNIPAP